MFWQEMLPLRYGLKVYLSASLFLNSHKTSKKTQHNQPARFIGLSFKMLLFFNITKL